MFIVNALLFFFQVISLIIWYFAFASFSVQFYKNPCTDADNPTPEQAEETYQCNKGKVQVRGTAIKWWAASNTASFISQIALAYILCSFAQKKEKKPVLTSKAAVETEVESVLAPAIETEADDDEDEFTLLGSKLKDNLSSINRV